jgi:hypothetical protein
MKTIVLILLSMLCLACSDFTNLDKLAVNTYLKSKGIEGEVVNISSGSNWGNQIRLKNGELYYVGGVEIKLPREFAENYKGVK